MEEEEETIGVLPCPFRKLRIYLNFMVNSTISIVSSTGNQQLFTLAILSHLTKGTFQ